MAITAAAAAAAAGVTVAITTALVSAPLILAPALSEAGVKAHVRNSTTPNKLVYT